MLPVGLAVLGAYLLGSIPFGVVFGRLRGVDLRSRGSGNIGATNAARVLGKKAGAIVLLCDAAKGWLPVWAAARWLAPIAPWGYWAVAAVGAAAFLGHLAPPWLRFRGGKGVATALGVFLALAPGPTLVAVLVFVLVYALWRIASLGSLCAVTAFLPALWLWRGRREELALAALVWLLIVAKHHGNIARLFRHAENRV
jgi:glycerol-3-phosphate acyltransferase PlsY